MTEQQIAEHKAKIDGMSHEEMARLHRWAPAGHPYFQTTSPLFAYFHERWDTFGGMTPAMSKRIGWER